MNVHIITIGDEILIGQIIDTNSAWIGEQLNEHGYQIQKIISISDDHEEIVSSIRNSLKEVDVVLMTGGLGPTKDDITKVAIADYFNVKMVLSTETLERIERFFERLGRSLLDSHRQQCMMPENATLLKNKMGTAPGMWFEDSGKVLVSMPGVPYEMKYLMEFEVIPKLKENFKGKSIQHRTILTVGEGESRIAGMIEKEVSNFPEHIKMAFLPSLGTVRLRLSGSGGDATALTQLLDEKSAQIEALIPDLVFGHGKEKLEAVVGQLLLKNKKKLAIAESCTGGLLAHKIVSIPGSSAYFKGGFVTYDNQLKERLLGVKSETLEKHGAVSEETVKEMAKGALTNTGADVTISISGIAGPTGGTEEKPVGTIWLALAANDHIRTKKLQLGKDRLKNIQYTTVQALNMIRKFLLEQ